MRKIILIAVIAILAISLKAQGIYKWEGSIDMGAVVAVDTVIQPKITQMPPGVTIGGFVWSVTIDAEGLNENDATVEIGGCNQTTRGSTKNPPKFKFNNFDDILSGETMPYTLDSTVMVDTVRNWGYTEVTYTVSWVGDSYYFDLPMMRFTKGTDVSPAYIRYYWRF